MPWANDGNPVWNANRCTPVPADAGRAGDPCTVTNVPYSGIDSCDAGFMCWDADPESLEGTCVQLCGEDGPSCANEAESCVIGNEGSLPLCLTACDPLAATCGEGQGCYPVDESFVCLREGVRLFDEGIFQADCPAGTFVANPEVVSGCPEEGPCCTAFCDVDDVEACGADAFCEPYFGIAGSNLGFCDVASVLE